MWAILRGTRRLALLALAGLFIIQLGSQSQLGTVAIASIPDWGQDGKIIGYVYGASSDQFSLYAFAFIPDLGWSALPNCGKIPIQGSGQFSFDAAPTIIFRNATRFSAFLLPASLTAIPCIQGVATLPYIVEHNAVSSATIPRIPRYKTLSFGGLEWYIKTAPVQVYPGPQFFTDDNAYVDNAGQLHLKLTKCSDSWCAAQIYTKQSIGYGTYQFVINSQLNNLDPNLTLGLFTWDAQAGDRFNREWDIEFGRWGDASAPANAQYVVQPYDSSGHLTRFLMSPSSPSTHTVYWSSNQARFVSTSSGGMINQWTYSGSTATVPTPGDVHLHLNLYVSAHQAPASPYNQEIVISSFQYTPASSQIGFSTGAATIPFVAGSYSAPITTTSLGCSAIVESDAPWLKVVGPKPVSGGGAIQYSVTDNFGAARTANLILQSTDCNAVLGGQVLTISQDGLVCNPTFASSSTHLGFLQSVRSVLIRGTAAVCSWTVTSSAPWLQITSASTGAGDGSVEFQATANSDPTLRSAWLSLDNGKQHMVYQDAAIALFALSPQGGRPCGLQQARFGISWVADTAVEVRLNSPTGVFIDAFGASGSTMLPQVSDGTLIFLVRPGAPPESAVLASARADVLPNDCSAPSIGALGIVNAASYSSVSVAPTSHVTVFGSNLATTTALASSANYPTSLGGVSVVLDGQQCPLSYVSPGQINFLIPAGMPTGRHPLTVGSASGEVIVTNASPGIFTLRGDGSGVPLASVIAVAANGSSVASTPYQCGSAGCQPSAISIPPGTTDLYVILYGTGLRHAQTVAAMIGAYRVAVEYAGPQSQYPGLDQVNLHMKGPNGLTGSQPVLLQADGFSSNTVQIGFQ